MTTLLLILLPYIMLAGLTFYAVRPFIKEIVEETIDDSKMNIEPIMVTLMGLFWPITIFGLGIGWSVSLFWVKKKAQVSHIINSMVNRLEESERPVTTDEWITFVSENIGRIPRHKLNMMVVIGVEAIELEEKVFNRIVSSELADRDLFDSKF